jgi:hypothetical protein
MTIGRRSAVALVIASTATLGSPTVASAGILNPLCNTIGLASGAVGKACNVISKGKKLVGAGRKLLSGHLGGAVQTVLGGAGGGGVGSAATTAVGLAAIVTWVVGGASLALHETAKVIGRSTSPQLGTTWFSATYWRMAGVAALVTLPFLFAAAVQAVVQSDLALLTRATLGYLPLALLAVGVAAPVAMLLLAATDQMSSVVSAAAGNAAGHFLGRVSLTVGALTLISGSPFLAFLIGLFTAAAALVLWMELALREAAVYVIVLLLPLAFASFVWPARRVWAIRAVELLVALILSKFVIVAVLALGGAALSQAGHGGIAAGLAGVVLLLLGAFSPWALLRLLPLTELASGAVGSLRADARASRPATELAGIGAHVSDDWVQQTTAEMRRDADRVAAADDGGAAGPDNPARAAGCEPPDPGAPANPGPPQNPGMRKDQGTPQHTGTPQPPGTPQDPEPPQPPGSPQDPEAPPAPDIDAMFPGTVILGPEGLADPPPPSDASP